MKLLSAGDGEEEWDRGELELSQLSLDLRASSASRESPPAPVMIRNNDPSHMEKSTRASWPCSRSRTAGAAHAFGVN